MMTVKHDLPTYRNCTQFAATLTCVILIIYTVSVIKHSIGLQLDYCLAMYLLYIVSALLYLLCNPA